MNHDNGGVELPTYPDPQGHDSTVRITREATFKAWSGRPERLFALEREVARVLGEFYAEHTAQLSGPKTVEKANQALANLRLYATVSAAEGRLRRTGSLGAIFAEMDSSEVETIWLNNRTEDLARYPKIELRISDLSVSDTFPAVSLKVTGNDRQWVGGVYDLVSGELGKAVPGWSRMRSGWLAILLGFLISAGSAAATMSILSRNDSERGDAVLVGIFVTVLGTLFISLALHSIFLRLFPSLEILDAGGASKSRQTRALVVTVASMLLGIAGLVVGLLAL